MSASYSVEITGIERTRAEIAKLDSVIRELRKGTYSPSTSVTVASSLGGKDLLVHKIDALEGRVQTAVQKTMLHGVDEGKRIQVETLRGATTRTGLSGQSHVGGRNGAGRDDSGALIKAISRNVEVFKSRSVTVVTGFHGWGTEARGSGGDVRYAKFQEKGTLNHRSSAQKRRAKSKLRKVASGGVPAANSLGTAIIPVREYLKRELGKLKK